MKDQKAFLERCRELWEGFDDAYNRCRTWLNNVESVVSKETYGYYIEDAEAYLHEIQVHNCHSVGIHLWGREGGRLCNTFISGGVSYTGSYVQVESHKPCCTFILCCCTRLI